VLLKDAIKKSRIELFNEDIFIRCKNFVAITIDEWNEKYKLKDMHIKSKMFRAAFVENKKFKILPYLECSEIKNQMSIIIDKYWHESDSIVDAMETPMGEKISLYFSYPLIWITEIKADDEPRKQIEELDYKELFHYRHKTIFSEYMVKRSKKFPRSSDFLVYLAVTGKLGDISSFSVVDESAFSRNGEHFDMKKSVSESIKDPYIYYYKGSEMIRMITFDQKSLNIERKLFDKLKKEVKCASL